MAATPNMFAYQDKGKIYRPQAIISPDDPHTSRIAVSSV